MVRRAEGSIPGLSGTCWSLSPPGWCSVVSVVYGESRRLQCALTQTSFLHFSVALRNPQKIIQKELGKNKTKPKVHAERRLCSKSRGQVKDGGFALIIHLKNLHLCLMEKLLFNLISKLDLNSITEQCAHMFFKCIKLNR